MNPNPGSLFNVLSGMRHMGVGCRVTRSIYKFPDTYWIITKMNLSKDQKHGSAEGILVWRGVPKVKAEKIGPALKRQWNLIGTPNYKAFNGSTDAAYKLAPPRADGLTFENTRTIKRGVAAEVSV